MKLLLILLASVMSIDGNSDILGSHRRIGTRMERQIAPIAGDWQFVFLKVVGAVVSALFYG